VVIIDMARRAPVGGRELKTRFDDPFLDSGVERLGAIRVRTPGRY
jgi:hypothetical protein